MSVKKEQDLGKKSEVKRELSQLMASQRLAALATESGGEPYVNLVAFAASPDLAEIYFATPRATRKYDNLTQNPRVAVLVDNRAAAAVKLEDGMAVTAMGMVKEVPQERRLEVSNVFLARHPQMVYFISNSGTVLFSLEVELYICVFGLDRVVSLRVPV